MFSQNQRKPDSRIRWQNPRFKHRLEAQRSYKRPMRRLPETPAAVFLSKIGLGSWWSRWLTLLGFFLLVYLVFIPNFLFIKHVNIRGAADPAAVQSTINDYLGKKSFLPQKNILVLSKSGLRDFLLKNNPKVLKINRVSKKLPNTLAVDVTPRLDQFLLRTALGDYTLSSDGLATGQPLQAASSSLPSSLILIKLDAEANLAVGGQALPQPAVKFLQALATGLPAAVKAELDYFQLGDLQALDITAYLKTGAKILFNSDSDPSNALNRLSVLFAQLSDADRAKLFYVDMRSLDKAYVCLKGAACVKNISLPPPAASSTPSALSN